MKRNEKSEELSVDVWDGIAVKILTHFIPGKIPSSEVVQNPTHWDQCVSSIFVGRLSTQSHDSLVRYLN